MKRKYVFSRARMRCKFFNQQIIPVERSPNNPQDVYIGLRSGLGLAHTLPDEVLFAFRVYNNMSYISYQLAPSFYIVGEEQDPKYFRLFNPVSYYYNDRPVWRGGDNDLKTYYIYYGYRVSRTYSDGDMAYGDLQWVFTQTPPGEPVMEDSSEVVSHPILQYGWRSQRWNTETSSYSGIEGTISDGRTLSTVWGRWELEGQDNIWEDPIEEHRNFKLYTPKAGVYQPKDGYEGNFTFGLKDKDGEWYIPQHTRSPIYRLNNVYQWREL